MQTLFNYVYISRAWDHLIISVCILFCHTYNLRGSSDICVVSGANSEITGFIDD